MNVLVLGSGGREHALSWKIAQSSLLRELFIAPGNAGTSDHGTNVDLDVMDFPAIRDFVLERKISIVVVGPEAPLVEGIKDFFAADESLSYVTLVGPGSKASMLEGSKEFAKEFMSRHNIPTAKYGSFTIDKMDEANEFLESLKPPYVLKADGLAGGKGVIITESLDEAKNTLNEMFNGKFGDASSKVVIEEFLKGIELSMFVITDGQSYKILPEAKDYKRIGDGDTGPNTGGMGAVSPAPFANREFMEKVKNQVIIPTMKGLTADGLHFQGFLFFGLMKVNGDPYVIEYNVRMGDPETEVVIPRLKSDLLHLFDGMASHTLSECDLEIDQRTCATVMLVSEGYPGKYEKGKEVRGLENVPESSVVFHAGTKKDGEKTVTSGGRVMAVSSLGVDLEDAVKKSYENLEHISFEGMNFRTDIGADLRKKKAPQKN
ncbi:phosphoribosylamine--glycine ligase [Halocola ammonii]